MGDMGRSITEVAVKTNSNVTCEQTYALPIDLYVGTSSGRLSRYAAVNADLRKFVSLCLCWFASCTACWTIVIS